MGIPTKLDMAEEGDEYYDSVFYEDIEAPKFVDLTAPDSARAADDPSWFCLRIGCDQRHEQVDPEALHRSFFMRVMAARSPNVRLQKAISRANQSSMLKCPHSAPPKRPAARIARMSTATEAAEKAAKPRLRTHRICTLRASPVRAKAARIEASSARKKALTTPRSKTVRPRQEPFLSVKHQKEPVAGAAARKGTVVKALFMSTPKKEASQTPGKSQAPPLSDVCSKMRKLNLACREVPSRYLCQLSAPKTTKKGEDTAAKSVKGAQESRTNGKKKKILGRAVKCAGAETHEGNRNSHENMAAEETVSSGNEQKEVEVMQESRIEVERLQAGNCDDNKENLSHENQSTERDCESENQQLENHENVPHKVPKMQNKANAEQGGKLKKTTNPKPFRLRTDERKVLKEANPERKQTLAENYSMAVLKDANRVLQMGRCPDGKGRDKPTCSEKQKKQNTRAATGQLGEARSIFNSIRCNSGRPAMTKGRVVEKSQGVTRIPSSKARTTKTASGLVAPPQVGKERKTTTRISRLRAAAA